MNQVQVKEFVEQIFVSLNCAVAVEPARAGHYQVTVTPRAFAPFNCEINFGPGTTRDEVKWVRDTMIDAVFAGKGTLVEVSALRKRLSELETALTLPKVWSGEESDAMLSAYDRAQERGRGTRETLFAVGGALLRHRLGLPQVESPTKPISPPVLIEPPAAAVTEQETPAQPKPGKPKAR